MTLRLAVFTTLSVISAQAAAAPAAALPAPAAAPPAAAPASNPPAPPAEAPAGNPPAPPAAGPASNPPAPPAAAPASNPPAPPAAGPASNPPAPPATPPAPPAAPHAAGPASNPPAPPAAAPASNPPAPPAAGPASNPPAPPAAPLAAGPASNPPAPLAAPTVSDTTADASQDETTDAVGNEDIVVVGTPAVIAGSAISNATLERQETDDIHKALLAVAGVHVRDEDGYGLRPNIGMRGAAVERSAKVALMEDGVPIAPAPYSAPAAYYFPLTTRMSKIEAIKGPTAIQYGPNTVGGALNMQAAPLADARSAYLDIAAGAYRYGKLHARATEVRDCWTLQGEYVHLRSNGFKQLDGGGNTGFAKHDASLRGKWRALTWLVGYAHEDSNETYLGLTDEDFAKNPQRRYAASRNDHMRWQHWRMRADYLATLGNARILTTAYRNDFHRVWGKVDGLFGAPNAASVIAAPAANQIYYQILAGLADSESPEDELLFGINDRTFVSQGVQSTASWNVRHGAGMHFVDVGLRLHHDNALRIRYEEGYRMTDGAPVRSARARNTTVNSDTRALALAAFAHDRLMWKKLEAVGGVRVEAIRADVVDHLATNPATSQHTAGDIAIIPGLGAKYQLAETTALLVGVHRGFAPAPPSAEGAQKPELSVNYEAGARFASKRAALDVIGFIANYSNLKGACTLSAGCTAAQEGDQFDGGKARVVGLEAQGSAELQARRVRFPVNMAYTFAHSAFLTTFASDFASWGNVKSGDALPYLPTHQLAAQAAAATDRWELGASLRWQSNARDVAGTGTPSPATTVYGATVVGLSAHAYLHKHAELYATIDNLFNDQVIVARRPYGARPNSPRLFTLGYKARF